MIYLIHATGTGHYKIGYTNSYDGAQRRLINLQVGSPHKLRLVAQFEGDRICEAQLHKALKDCHVRGEWFNIGASKNAIKIISDTFGIKPHRRPSPTTTPIPPPAPAPEPKAPSPNQVLIRKETRKTVEAWIASNEPLFLVGNGFNIVKWAKHRRMPQHLDDARSVHGFLLALGHKPYYIGLFIVDIIMRFMNADKWARQMISQGPPARGMNRPVNRTAVIQPIKLPELSAAMDAFITRMSKGE